MVLGAGLGIGLTGWLSHLLNLPSPLTWIVAPMGASAVLVFGVPASPLAQPWAVVGGNTLSALVAVTCMHIAGPVNLAAAAAVALAIAVMFATRSLHPPGGATALLIVLSGADAVSKIEAGADVVQIYTGLIYKGAALVPEVARALRDRTGRR